MKEKYLLTETTEKVMTITIDREESLNAMSTPVWTELLETLEEAEKDAEVRVVIITGAGEKAFAAGADIQEMLDMNARNVYRNISGKAIRAIENLSKPVIAAINGYAFGGGCEIALACDIRIASENAQMGMPETNLGLIPGLGGTQKITKLAGLGLAKEIVLAGRVLRGKEIVEKGLAMKCVSQSELMAEATKAAAKMVKKGPFALSVAKTLLNQSAHIDVEAGMTFENIGFAMLLGTEDGKEGITAFSEKRNPVFQGK